MTDKFRNKYRVRPARAAWWNYGMGAAYFITICTKNREHFFGEITTVETPCMASLEITSIGKIAVEEWFKTSSIRPDMNLQLDEFVIMPNHLHGIIHIGKNNFNCPIGNRDAMHGVSTATGLIEPNEFGSQIKNFSSIIRGFKSAVTIRA